MAWTALVPVVRQRFLHTLLPEYSGLPSSHSLSSWEPVQALHPPSSPSRRHLTRPSVRPCASVYPEYPPLYAPLNRALRCSAKPGLLLKDRVSLPCPLAWSTGLCVEHTSCNFGESRSGLSSRAGGHRRSIVSPGPSSLVLLGVGGRSLPKPFSNLVVPALSPQDGSLQCPTCKTIYGVKTGTQPPGKMEYHLIPHSLPGHPDCKTIRIIYSIPPGVQVSPTSAIGCHCLGFRCLQVDVSFSPLKVL